MTTRDSRRAGFHASSTPPSAAGRRVEADIERQLDAYRRQRLMPAYYRCIKAVSRDFRRPPHNARRHAADYYY